MKGKLKTLALAASVFIGALLMIFMINQLYLFSGLLGALHPYAGYSVLFLGAAAFAFILVHAYSIWMPPSRPAFPENETSPSYPAYARHLARTLCVHPSHPEPMLKNGDSRWVKTNLKLLEVDALNATKELATKNFFIGAFAQNTSYGTTTSLMNNLKLVWRIYRLHHRSAHGKDVLKLYRITYESLPLSDFHKEELPSHIKPVVQAAFSNTLSSLLPGGNLLTPLFLNLFLAGATNTYLTCLTGIISMRYCQALSEEDTGEILNRSKFEASFMLREIISECNPILSVTVSNAVKKAGADSLDRVQPSPGGGNLAQDIVSHLAHSLKNIIRENVEAEKDNP
ncbi:hypothetical protein CHL67_08625 [Prosthecochloris sp. GSB1]|uniref:hypothetical protein n=1 Tax=Prosthecochloris sp. GSB1 TaxID=281093 RepID=UPI000B8D0F0A|nr:hypothetical protein [Prosthecochloris sp. GSB1]ASQ90973.1 hypothetical protein CHL67_08625 [Prosthecochloris sp. GSB1]